MNQNCDCIGWNRFFLYRLLIWRRQAPFSPYAWSARRKAKKSGWHIAHCQCWTIDVWVSVYVWLQCVHVTCSARIVDVLVHTMTSNERTSATIAAIQFSISFSIQWMFAPSRGKNWIGRGRGATNENFRLNRLNVFAFLSRSIVDRTMTTQRLTTMYITFILMCVVVQHSAGHRSDVYIAGFFPYGVGVENSEVGRGVMPSVKMALDHVNEHTEILRNYRLHMWWNDTQVSSTIRMTQNKFSIWFSFGAVQCGRWCEIILRYDAFGTT